MANLASPLGETRWPLYSENYARLVPLADSATAEECERNYGDLLAAENASGTVSSPERSLYIALLLSLVARAKIELKKISEASECLKAAELGVEDLNGVPISFRLLWLIERSRLSILERTPSQARISLSEAWSLAIPGGFTRAAIDVTQMMAQIEPEKLQLEWLKKGIEIAESSAEEGIRHVRDHLLLGLGWKSYEARRFAEALAIFDRVAAHAKKNVEVERSFATFAAAEWAAGKTLRAHGRVEEALARQLALLTEYDLRGTRSGDLYEEIAECLQSLKRPAEAEKYFDLAYREHLSNPPEQDRLPADLKRLKTLGKSK